MPNFTDEFQSKRGLCAVVSCLVQTLNETDPTFQQRFLDRLDAAYAVMREADPAIPSSTVDSASKAIEALSWVRELLTGWDMINGQGKPFLSHYEPKG